MTTKKGIKTKILKYAYEQCRPQPPHGGTIGCFNTQQLEKHLGMTTGDAQYRLYDALHELFIQNLIMKDPVNVSPYSMTLTSKGMELAKNHLDIEEYARRLENFARNEELLEKCQDHFNGGDYNVAVFEAYKLLEVKVRGKAELSKEFTGDKLMKKAFSPDKGVLRIPTCETEAEEIGILNLFQGVMLSFRNPEGHRIVDYENPRIVLQILLLAELLLSLTGIAIKR